MASPKGVALIVGCNGIVGFNLLKHMHDQEGEWSSAGVSGTAAGELVATYCQHRLTLML